MRTTFSESGVTSCLELIRNIEEREGGSAVYASDLAKAMAFCEKHMEEAISQLPLCMDEYGKKVPIAWDTPSDAPGTDKTPWGVLLELVWVAIRHFDIFNMLPEAAGIRLSMQQAALRFWLQHIPALVFCLPRTAHRAVRMLTGQRTGEFVAIGDSTPAGLTQAYPLLYGEHCASVSFMQRLLLGRQVAGQELPYVQRLSFAECVAPCVEQANLSDEQISKSLCWLTGDKGRLFLLDVFENWLLVDANYPRLCKLAKACVVHAYRDGLRWMHEKADVIGTYQDSDDNTLLHHAAEANATQIIPQLLHYCESIWANTEVGPLETTNAYGEIPGAVANRNGWSDCAEMLLP